MFTNIPKLLLLLVPKVTTRSLYPECIANLKLPIDTFYRESRSGVQLNIFEHIYARKLVLETYFDKLIACFRQYLQILVIDFIHI
jgi:hypothetical protein